ncbi:MULTISPECIES: STAS/SEC14 domain-containing protein [unclassified Mycobacterium]|uniref:STAS/SEC14 domain-containing protein n=1 Tax=unclassified Mycobacterium TaxID=2642494 RepID=UPI0007FD1F2C|nr:MULTISPECIES: STAS/SEC14 domain-containing protein [unclassified Mycobacterium]OBH02959.1 hypothetical protein A5696_09860 [Mycobacterium sp. E2699]OBI51067.1 hypothetical protein A5705_09610 [Mycobacterium sp. E787]
MLKELSGMPPGIQALEAVGTVTAADYGRVFAPLVDRARRSGSRMRLLYQFGPAFQRITAGALWADARVGLGYLPILDGCAVVSDIGWVRAPARDIGAWMPCPARVFDNAERDDAVAWLASLGQASDVSARDMAKAYIGGVGAAVASPTGLLVSRGIGHPASAG